VVAYLITPTEVGPWRVDPGALGEWLASRWLDVVAQGDGRGQRAYLWTWPDGSEIWVPEDADVVWAQLDLERLAAVAGWCAAGSPEQLVLTDEEYSQPLTLTSTDEETILALLSR